MTSTETLPDWADAIVRNAAEEPTAQRLIGQLVVLQTASLAFCRLLERWARGEADPSTPGRRAAALRRAADRVETALTGLDGRSAATCSSSRPAPPRAGRGSASRATRSSSTGARCSNGPGSPRRHIASPPRTSSWPCSSGRSKDSRPRCAGDRPPTAARSGPVCSTCARTCSDAHTTTCARSLRKPLAL